MTALSRALFASSALSARRMAWPRRLAAALAIAAAAFLLPAPDASARTVAVIDREDIALSGAATLDELLNSRAGFNVFGRYGALMGTGTATILVNGRPISGVDLSTLPLAAVERVELLDQGPVRHSAFAIGRTTNIVLRDDFEGLELSAGAGLPGREGMDSRQGSALWGGALGRGHMTVAAAHVGRDELRARDRHFSRTRYTPGGSYADTQGVSDYGNTVILPRDDAGLGGRFGLGDCNEPTYTGILSHPGGEVCGFPSGDIYWLRGRESRESVQLAADQPLDDDSDVYVEARIAQGETFSVSAPNLDAFSIQPDADTWQRLRGAVINLPPGYALPTDGGVTLLHRFVGHGNREWTTDLEEHEFTLGARSEPDGGLGYDVHVEYYKHKEVLTGINLQSVSLVSAAIARGDYDLANPLSQAPAHRQAIRDTAIRSTQVEEDEYTRANASLEGETLTMAGGAVRWTLGVEVEDRDHRDVQDFRDNRNISYKSRDVIGYGGTSLVAERRRFSVLAESSVPLIEGWDLTLGARRDDYDDVGEAISLHATNRYRLNDNLAFRTSWSQAAHPPTLFWVHSPQAQYFVRICDPLLKDENGEPLCGQPAHLITGGNPDLEPDRVERLSVGATTTFGGVSFSADWFSVDQTDLLALADLQVVVDRAAAGNPLPGTAVERNTAGDNSIDRIINPIGQFGESEERGVALHAGVDWETDWADIALDVHATRTTHYRYVVLGEEEPGGYVRNRAHAVLQARRGDIVARWSVYGRSGYLNSTETGRYKSWYGHDLALQWRDLLGMGMDLAGGVLNIANRDASLDPSGDQGTVRTLDSDRGRTFFLNATMRW